MEDLIASTGSSREALQAGMNPETRPIIVDIDIPSVIFPRDN